MPESADTVGLGAPPTAPSSAMSTRVEVYALIKGRAYLRFSNSSNKAKYKHKHELNAVATGGGIF
jgi:hypothetical protein